MEPDNVEVSNSVLIKSPAGEDYFPEGKVTYPTNHYRAAKLPSMQFKREEKGNVRFRLAVFPSEAKPIFLTYSRCATGASIEVTRLQLRIDNNNLQLGDIDLCGKVAVGNRIARVLEADAISPSIRNPLAGLTEVQRQFCEGLDGSTWVIEVSTDIDYTVNCIWTPEAILAEPLIFEELKKQKVDVNLIAGNLNELILFRDLLLELTDMKMARYPISALLDDEKPTAQPDGDKPSK